MGEQLNEWMNENKQVENDKSLQNRFITKWSCFKLLHFADSNTQIGISFMVTQKSAARQERTLYILTSSPGFVQQAMQHNAQNQTLNLMSRDMVGSLGTQEILQLLLPIYGILFRNYWHRILKSFVPLYSMRNENSIEMSARKLFNLEMVTLLVVVNALSHTSNARIRAIIFDTHQKAKSCLRKAMRKQEIQNPCKIILRLEQTDFSFGFG